MYNKSHEIFSKIFIMKYIHEKLRLYARSVAILQLSSPQMSLCTHNSQSIPDRIGAD